jgi:hypothetical protein
MQCCFGAHDRSPHSLAAAGEAASITTIKLALPLVKGMLSAAIGGGFENDLALTTMGATYTAASLMSLGEESEFSADIVKDNITSTAEKIIVPRSSAP